MKAVHKVIYTCEEATKKMLQDKEEISLMSRIRLKMHLLMCHSCKRFNIQNQWIDKQLKKLSKQPSTSKMDPACREKIAKALESELAKDNN